MDQLENTAVLMMVGPGQDQTKAKRARPKGKPRTVNQGEISPEVPRPDDKALFEHISQFGNLEKCLKEALPSIGVEEPLMIYRRLILQLLALDEIPHENIFVQIADAIFSSCAEHPSSCLDE